MLKEKSEASETLALPLGYFSAAHTPTPNCTHAHLLWKPQRWMGRNVRPPCPWWCVGTMWWCQGEVFAEASRAQDPLEIMHRMSGA